MVTWVDFGWLLRSDMVKVRPSSGAEKVLIFENLALSYWLLAFGTAKLGVTPGLIRG
jgi:hypothetical protein